MIFSPWTSTVAPFTGSAPVPAGIRTIDIPGKWVVPGMIDSHIHFMTSGRMYTRPAFFDLTDKVSYEEEITWIKDNLAANLRAHICSGVTSEPPPLLRAWQCTPVRHVVVVGLA